ncbi:MAG: peroxiredoxin [Nitrososphaeria archaeon]|nr:peroxiredoxin [Conexivisphaerales archaeon]
MLKTGDTAPDFELLNQEGKVVKLSDLKGKPVVIYFYPKDFTTGCTAEAKDFNENIESISSKGVIVIGISADSVDSHKKFSQKLGLRFYILSDPERKVIKAYGAQVGNRTRRMTYIIDKDGKIAFVFPKVVPVGHSKEVLEKLKELKLI